MLHLISFLVLCLIFTGIYFRKRSRKMHVFCMGTAFVTDLALVIYIEIMRHAVERVTHHMTPLLAFHVTVSVTALLGYVAQIILGIWIWKEKSGARFWHRWVGTVFLVCRCINFVTSFMVQTKS